MDKMRIDLSTYLYSFAGITQVEVKEPTMNEVIFSGYVDSVIQQIEEDYDHEYYVLLGKSETYAMISRGKLIVYPEMV